RARFRSASTSTGTSADPLNAASPIPRPSRWSQSCSVSLCEQDTTTPASRASATIATGRRSWAGRAMTVLLLQLCTRGSGRDTRAARRRTKSALPLLSMADPKSHDREAMVSRELDALFDELDDLLKNEDVALVMSKRRVNTSLAMLVADGLRAYLQGEKEK